MNGADVEGQGAGVRGQGYQQLVAWQKAHNLALDAFRCSETLRARHRWLADQLVRSAVSVPANIAEGYSRGSLREYLHFLNIARGSLGEVEYYLIFSRDASLISPADFDKLLSMAREAARLLFGLIKAIQAKAGVTRSASIRDASFAYDSADVPLANDSLTLGP